MKKNFCLCLLALCFNFKAFPQTFSKSYKAAKKFVETLDKVQLAKSIYKFEDDERVNWHFVPKSRNGLPLKELNETQRKAAIDLLKASLSEQGSQKALAIIQLEIVLKEIESRGDTDHYRDPGKYYFSFFGKPEEKKLWAWRIEGHHLALNFTANNGQLTSATPTFMGSNPGKVLNGKEKGKEVLKMETDLGFSLINSLNESQKKIAIFSPSAPPEIITGNKRAVSIESQDGITFNELNGDQQKKFMQLLGTFVKNYPHDFADDLMRKIEKAGLDKLKFAWAGSLVAGTPNYYRIQNPAIFIEYDNTQNNANHVHVVVRQPDNDFGDDVLKNHYQKSH